MLSLTCVSTKSFDLKKALVPIVNRYTDLVDVVLYFNSRIIDLNTLDS